MNYSDLKKGIEILLVDETQAGAMCGKISVFHEICARFGIKPVVQRKSVKLWSVAHIKAGVARMGLESA